MKAKPYCTCRVGAKEDGDECGFCCGFYDIPPKSKPRMVRGWMEETHWAEPIDILAVIYATPDNMKNPIQVEIKEIKKR